LSEAVAALQRSSTQSSRDLAAARRLIPTSPAA